MLLEACSFHWSLLHNNTIKYQTEVRKNFKHMYGEKGNAVVTIDGVDVSVAGITEYLAPSPWACLQAEVEESKVASWPSQPPVPCEQSYLSNSAGTQSSLKTALLGAQREGLPVLLCQARPLAASSTAGADRREGSTASTRSWQSLASTCSGAQLSTSGPRFTPGPITTTPSL